MNTTLSIPTRIASAAIVSIVVALALAGSAYADEHRGRRHEIGEPYRAPHWIYDDRYHHGHYYPTIGYSVAVLPPGYLSLGFGSRHFYFQGGVWFAPAAGGFAVVRPPVGIVVPTLPPAYTTVWIGGAPYYYANDIYYAPAPGGYAVTAPPAGTTYTEAPAVSPACRRRTSPGTACSRRGAAGERGKPVRRRDVVLLRLGEGVLPVRARVQGRLATGAGESAASALASVILSTRSRAESGLTLVGPIRAGTVRGAGAVDRRKHRAPEEERHAPVEGAAVAAPDAAADGGRPDRGVERLRIDDADGDGAGRCAVGRRYWWRTAESAAAGQ